jgi:hypothetical protein
MDNILKDLDDLEYEEDEKILRQRQLTWLLKI